MATSTYPATGGFVDNTSAANFIPEHWSDEVIAAEKANLVMAGLVRKMNFTGKKGDTVHVPRPGRGSANAKAENTAVTVQNDTAGVLDVNIDQHFEYSYLIEDITDTQALSSLRKFITDDAGYALATQKDSDLFQAGKSWGDSDGADWVHSNSFYSNAGTSLDAYAVDTVAAADDLTDVILRLAIQQLDDQNVPMTNRSWVVPPIAKRDLLGIDRLNSQDFTNVQKGVVTGRFGQAYGVDFYTSTNVPIIETAADNAGGDDVYGSQLFHRDAIVCIEQMNVRSQFQYKQEWLGTLYTSDTLYGYSPYQLEHGIVVAIHGT